MSTSNTTIENLNRYNVFIATGEVDPLGISLCKEFLSKGQQVTLLVHPNHFQHHELSELKQLGCNLLKGDARTLNVEELASFFQGHHLIISASLFYSIFHPLTQFETERNIMKACLLYQRQDQSCFRRYIPCDWTFDYEISFNVQLQTSIESCHWLALKEKIKDEIERSTLVYTTIFGGMPFEVLFDTKLGIIDLQNRIINYYGDADTPFDCTSINDLSKFTVDLLINSLYQSENREYRIKSDRITINQLANLLGGFKLNYLGSIDDCEREIYELKEHNAADRTKLELMSILGSGRGKQMENEIYMKSAIENRLNELKVMKVQDFVQSHLQQHVSTA
ncbi:hypothetical protein ABK040_010977 [Willaertia magna]